MKLFDYSIYNSNDKRCIDWVFLGCCFLLCLIGAVMVLSSSSEIAQLNFKDPLFFFKKHCIYLILGIFIFLFTITIPIKYFYKFSALILFFNFLCLIIVLIPQVGAKINGASRWLKFGSLTFQPSELAKIASIFYISSYLVRYQADIKQTISSFFRPFVVIIPNAILLLMEPDFGATFILVLTTIILLFLGGVKITAFLGTTLLTSIVLIGILFLQEYRIKRILSFLNPWEDPLGTGYQLINSLMAFGRGEFFGVGLGNSLQKQFYLPESYTDFTFAILGEEFGLLGCLLVIAIFSLTIYRIFKIALYAHIIQNLYASYVAYGIGAMWSSQFLINTFVNTGLLPTKGLTLPFLSYGGSSLLILFVCMGIITRISYEVQQLKIINFKNINLE